MIDYLIAFENDNARAQAFPRPEDSPNIPCWDAMGGTVMPIIITVQDPVFNDEDGTQISPRILAPGSWVVLRIAERSQEIEDMPGCELCTDPDLAAMGQRYVHFSRLEPETILGQVSPVFAGGGYAIPVGQPASVLDDWLIEQD